MFNKVSYKKVKEISISEPDKVMITREDKISSPVNMKKNIDKGFVVVVDSEKENMNGFKVFNLIGVNCNNNIWETENVDFPHWIKWKRLDDKKILVQKYSIMNQELYGKDYKEEYMNQNIRSWTLQGSDDNNTWIDLDKVILTFNLGNKGIIRREIENNVEYNWIRLVITSNFSSEDKTISIGMIKTWYKEEN